MERRRKPTVTGPNGSRPHPDQVKSLSPEIPRAPITRGDDSVNINDHLPSDLADWLNRENDRTSGASPE